MKEEYERLQKLFSRFDLYENYLTEAEVLDITKGAIDWTHALIREHTLYLVVEDLEILFCRMLSLLSLQPRAVRMLSQAASEGDETLASKERLLTDNKFALHCNANVDWRSYKAKPYIDPGSLLRPLDNEQQKAARVLSAQHTSLMNRSERKAIAEDRLSDLGKLAASLYYAGGTSDDVRLLVLAIRTLKRIRKLNKTLEDWQYHKAVFIASNPECSSSLTDEEQEDIEIEDVLYKEMEQLKSAAADDAGDSDISLYANNACPADAQSPERLSAFLRTHKVRYKEGYNEESFLKALQESYTNKAIVKTVNDMLEVGINYNISAKTLHDALKSTGFYSASYQNFAEMLNSKFHK